MTPKEKAEELVNKYLITTPIQFQIEDAKKCALIAVDEMMKLFYVDGGIDCFQYIYWAEVKNEIELL